MLELLQIRQICSFFQIAVYGHLNKQYYHPTSSKFLTNIYLKYIVKRCSNFRNVTKTCLMNSPVSPFAIASATYLYPGQFYTLPQQCQLALGPTATSAGCNVFL